VAPRAIPISRDCDPAPALVENLEPNSHGLRWRHLPTIHPSAIVANPNTTTIDTPSYDAFDLSGGFMVQDKWQLRYGIDNLLDKEPVFTNATRYTRGTTTLGGFYDVLGRRAYVGMSVSF